MATAKRSTLSNSTCCASPISARRTARPRRSRATRPASRSARAFRSSRRAIWYATSRSLGIGIGIGPIAHVQCAAYLPCFVRDLFLLMFTTPQALAKLLLLDELGIDSLHAVIGASLGGCTAIEVAASAPTRVQRLLAVAATARARCGCSVASFSGDFTLNVDIGDSQRWKRRFATCAARRRAP